MIQSEMYTRYNYMPLKMVTSQYLKYPATTPALIHHCRINVIKPMQFHHKSLEVNSLPALRCSAAVDCQGSRIFRGMTVRRKERKPI